MGGYDSRIDAKKMGGMIYFLAQAIIIILN